MARYIEVVPAYGRDYKAAKDVKAAWEEGKDFQIASVDHPDCGRYLNKHDTPAGTKIQLRYRKLTLMVIVTA